VSALAGIVTDGPYVEAKEIIVSFAVIQADDYGAALAIARACPGDISIEIREMAGYARANRARWWSSSLRAHTLLSGRAIESKTRFTFVGFMVAPTAYTDSTSMFHSYQKPTIAEPFRR
jgi:hypothetical protein